MSENTPSASPVSGKHVSIAGIALAVLAVLLKVPTLSFLAFVVGIVGTVLLTQAKLPRLLGFASMAVAFLSMGMSTPSVEDVLAQARKNGEQVVKDAQERGKQAVKDAQERGKQAVKDVEEAENAPDIDADAGSFDQLLSSLPASLRENAEVKEYYQAMYALIDEYANMMETAGKMSQKSTSGGDDLANAMQGLQEMTNAMQRMGPAMQKLEELKKKSEGIKKGLSGKDAIVFSKFYFKILQRFAAAERKIKK